MNENVSLRQAELLVMCIGDAYKPGLSVSTLPLRLILGAQGRHASGWPSCRPPTRDFPTAECANFLFVDDQTASAFTITNDGSLREEEHEYR